MPYRNQIKALEDKVFSLKKQQIAYETEIDIARIQMADAKEDQIYYKNIVSEIESKTKDAGLIAKIVGFFLYRKKLKQARANLKGAQLRETLERKAVTAARIELVAIERDTKIANLDLDRMKQLQAEAQQQGQQQGSQQNQQGGQQTQAGEAAASWAGEAGEVGTAQPNYAEPEKPPQEAEEEQQEEVEEEFDAEAEEELDAEAEEAVEEVVEDVVEETIENITEKEIEDKEEDLAESVIEDTVEGITNEPVGEEKEDQVSEIVEEADEETADVSEELSDNIKETVSEVRSSTAGVMGGVGSAFGRGATVVKDKVQEIKSNAAAAIGRKAEVVRGKAEDLINRAKEMPGRVKTAVAGKMGEVKDRIKDTSRLAKDKVLHLKDLAVATGKALGVKVEEGVHKVKESVGNAAIKTGNSIKLVAKKAQDSVKGLTQGVLWEVKGGKVDLSSKRNAGNLSRVGMTVGGKPNRHAKNLERLISKRPEIIATLPAKAVEQFVRTEAERVSSGGEVRTSSYMQRLEAQARAAAKDDPNKKREVSAGIKGLESVIKEMKKAMTEEQKLARLAQKQWQAGTAGLQIGM